MNHRRITVALPRPPTLDGMAMEAGLRRLSLREARVARLVAEGLSDEQVGERLGIAVADVRADLADVFRKLGLRSRTELALLAPDGENSPPNGDAGGA
jgi:DNA-binding CsgD family transcriptional regulator